MIFYYKFWTRVCLVVALLKFVYTFFVFGLTLIFERYCTVTVYKVPETHNHVQLVTLYIVNVTHPEPNHASMHYFSSLSANNPSKAYYMNAKTSLSKSFKIHKFILSSDVIGSCIIMKR